MAQKIDKEQLQNSWQDLFEFEYQRDVFYRSSELRTNINKMFGGSIQAAYSTSKDNDFTDGFDWSGESIILINNQNKIVLLLNSEWASFSFL